MANYRIGGYEMQSASLRDEMSQNVLRLAYEENVSPLCLCADPPLKMYLAKVNDFYIVKRMPNSGAKHALSCNSFESFSEISGRNGLMGTAIIQNGAYTLLKTDFPLVEHLEENSKSSEDVENTDEEAEEKTNKQEAEAPPKALTLRGLLHYLWAESGLTFWSPDPSYSKRNWSDIYAQIAATIEGKTVKRNVPLSTQLYVPEGPATAEGMNEAIARREKLFQEFESNGKNKKLLMFMGETKASFQMANSGHKLVLVHDPGIAPIIPEQMYIEIQSTFSELFAFYGGLDVDAHLICFGTLSINSLQVVTVERLTFMVVNKDWIPVEYLYEYDLVNKLMSEGRTFIKELRYNLGLKKPIAVCTLTDTGTTGHILFIRRPRGNPDVYNKHFDALIQECKQPTWIWEPGHVPSPFPPIATNNIEIVKNTLPVAIDDHVSMAV